MICSLHSHHNHCPSNGMHCGLEDREARSAHIPSDLEISIVEESLTRPSLSLSLGSTSISDEPLPIASLAPTQSSSQPQLRTWRITREGLVAVEGIMGAFLDKPKTCKDNLSGEGKGFNYAISSMQGWRVDMEDAHAVELAMGDGPFSDWSLFAVFDGHAGAMASKDAADHILKCLLDTEQFQKMSKELCKEGGGGVEACKALLEEGITQGFLALDETIKISLEENKNKERSGTTAVSAIVTPSHIILANLGDSRAVLAKKDGESFGTEDHKPSVEKERKRIIEAGGSVMIQRINGSLAVSRALGDFEYKAADHLHPHKQQVSAQPDVYFLPRNKEEDEFLILACDGIYDVMTNDELCNFVRSRLRVTKDLKAVCSQVLDACLTKGSRDNMTVLLILFPCAPIVDEYEMKEEKKIVDCLNAACREIITEMFESGDTYEDISVEAIHRKLVNVYPEAIPSEGPLRLLLRGLIETVMDEEDMAKGLEKKKQEKYDAADSDGDGRLEE